MAVVFVGLPKFFVRTRVVCRREEPKRWSHSLLVEKLGVNPHYHVRFELISDAVFLEPRIQLYDGIVQCLLESKVIGAFKCFPRRLRHPARDFDYG